jgi:hypothetical protein
MPTIDEAVLEYIGLAGKLQRDVLGRFPGFDVTRLVRAQLVALADQRWDTQTHILDASRMRYVLTQRGAEAIGIISKQRFSN